MPEPVADRGWSVQVFDEQLEDLLGEVDVPAGERVLEEITTDDVVPRPSTSSSSRTRAGSAASSPAPGRSASCAPAATWAGRRRAVPRRPDEPLALEVGRDRAQHRADLAGLRPVRVTAVTQPSPTSSSSLIRSSMIGTSSSGFFRLFAATVAATDGSGSRIRTCSAWSPRLPATMPNSTR
ncbi:hypothetical protein [Blastococcus brunescens]|uniref:Uncharacterized protein n=1 Tax=Blastococcus brunescens TaxID=1564165 RepID=A0ABZ1B1B9_9ACTN|nr:hypothetical protein [Blastococcus sp. BMG 8361]WRL64614.1 hypothetical protein U6N30_02100 [Blastococcus sp. BMG 8361]